MTNADKWKASYQALTEREIASCILTTLETTAVVFGSRCCKCNIRDSCKLDKERATDGECIDAIEKWLREEATQ